MQALLSVLLLSASAGFLFVSALELHNIQEHKAETVDHSTTLVERVLSGASRRKYLPNGGNSLAVPSTPVMLMDDDEDNDDEEDDEDDGDYHHFNVDSNGDVSGKALPSNVEKVKNDVKAVSHEKNESKSKPLLMPSLSSNPGAASKVPESATDVIANYFADLRERFHLAMKTFFDNIDNQLKKNRELPLLEHGDTFF